MDKNSENGTHWTYMGDLKPPGNDSKSIGYRFGEHISFESIGVTEIWGFIPPGPLQIGIMRARE
jgi:hypothetical protein